MITDETQSSRWLAPSAFAALYSATGLPVLLTRVDTFATSLGTVCLAAFLVALSAVDARTFRLPDALTLPLVAAGLINCAITEKLALPQHALAAALGYLSLYAVERLYKSLRGGPGLGLGDAKLYAAGGAWVGLDHLADIMLVATLLALAVVGCKALLGQTVEPQTKIAFGPFLAFGIWLVWLLGLP